MDPNLTDWKGDFMTEMGSEPGGGGLVTNPTDSISLLQNYFNINKAEPTGHFSRFSGIKIIKVYTLPPF